MKIESIRVEKGRGFVAPRFTPWMYTFLKVVGPLYNRKVQGIAGIRTFNMERLYQSFLDFQEGRTRLMILLRHVHKADGPVVLQTVVKELAAWCRRTRNPLKERPYTHFLYDKDVLNWAGAAARWAFPKMGGIPVVNGRLDKQSHLAIREVLNNGRFPLCLAPEGQITYHSFRTFDFAPGAATLAAWTHRDLRRDDRPEPVVILPMAIGYRYSKNMPALIERIITMLDEATGLQTKVMNDPRAAMLQLTDYLIDTLEEAYQNNYPEIVDLSEPLDVQGRIDRLCDQMLRCHEVAVGYSSEGTILERIFRVRYWVMESLHREEIDPDALTPVERSLADNRAQIAAGIENHQLIVDVLEYVHPSYILEGCSQTRLVEYGLNLLDLCNRAEGGNIESRFSPKNMVAQILFGPPIDSSARFDEVGEPSRLAIGNLADEVKDAFNSLVVELEQRME